MEGYVPSMDISPKNEFSAVISYDSIVFSGSAIYIEASPSPARSWRSTLGHNTNSLSFWLQVDFLLTSSLAFIMWLLIRSISHRSFLTITLVGNALGWSLIWLLCIEDRGTLGCTILRRSCRSPILICARF